MRLAIAGLKSVFTHKLVSVSQMAFNSGEKVFDGADMTDMAGIAGSGRRFMPNSTVARGNIKAGLSRVDFAKTMLPWPIDSRQNGGGVFAGRRSAEGMDASLYEGHHRRPQADRDRGGPDPVHFWARSRFRIYARATVPRIRLPD